MKVQNLGSGRGIALSALLLATTAFAWLGVIQSATAMQMPQMEPLSGAALIAFTLEWGVMMTAMMLPSAAPMILVYGMTSRRPGKSSERVIPAEMFAMTYVVLWVLTGVPVYLAWVGIGELAVRSTTFAATLPYAVAATLLAAAFTSSVRRSTRACGSARHRLISWYVAGARATRPHYGSLLRTRRTASAAAGHSCSFSWWRGR